MIGKLPDVDKTPDSAWKFGEAILKFFDWIDEIMHDQDVLDHWPDIDIDKNESKDIVDNLPDIDKNEQN